MAADAFEDGFFHGWNLREAGGCCVESGIPRDVVAGEIFCGLIGEARVEDWDVDEAGFGIEGHGLPTVRAAGARRNDGGLVG
jgi:hypothetical protein